MELCRVTLVTLGYNTQSYMHEAEAIYMKTHTI